ncbi:MAG: AMIN domain-containing protein [Thermostichus sp. DG02_3_bins_51]
MMNRRVAYGCALSLILSLPMLAMESRVEEATAQQLTSANPQSPSRIKDIRLVPNGNRMKLEIDTVGGTRPQVFFTQQGRSWIGDITNAQLDMGPGGYRQESPLPGVSFIEARQVGNDSVRIQIAGASAAPQGLLAQRSPTQLVFDFEGLPSAQVAAAPGQATMPVIAPVAQPPAPQPLQPIAQNPVQTPSQPPASAPAAPAAPAAPVAQPPAPQPLQPIAQNPVQTPSQPPANPPAAAAPAIISQVPAVNQLNQPQLPPGALPNGSQFQGRAIAPPSGDIAVGTILPNPPTVDLGSNAKITLTLKDAPVGDVLSLLVRRAGLNVVLNDVPPDLTISLDVSDSPLQDTFNFILRLKELQAQRSGQTVFIGRSLPGVTDRIIRNYRVNQAVASNVSQILTAILEAVTPGSPAQVEVDERTNSITVIGTNQQHDIVAAQLAQLDVRRRQVLINLRVVDVQLNNNSSLGVALGAASGNFAFSGLDPRGGFGGQPLNQPEGSSSPPNIGSQGGAQTLNFSTLNRLQQFLAMQLQAAVENGTAKVLADPKIAVAEGGESVLEIGQDVVTNRQIRTDPATGQTVQSLELETAGVTLNISDVRIDDNGYITLSIQPTITSPGQSFTLADGTVITRLARRQANLQTIRFRDGETFVIAGLIQDQDRVSVNKVPLLAEIPLLGALFRRQTVTNERSEVVVMVTPYILRDDIAFGFPSGR